MAERGEGVTGRERVVGGLCGGGGEGRKDKDQNKMTKINAKLVLISSQITTDPGGDAEQPTQSKKSKNREQRWRSGRAQHAAQ